MFSDPESAGARCRAAGQCDSADALEHLARAVLPGRTAVVAEVAESDPGLVDEALAGVSAWIVRRFLADVEAELGAARDAVAAAGEEARRVLRGIGPNPG
jgi:hypothetical protein